MRHDDMLADEKSEAESTRALATVEWFEEDIAELTRHAGSFVVHFELDRVIAPPVHSN
jgi:hypothetical protein